MPLQKLQFRPGVIRDVTAYTNTGGWFDCNNVRFKNGLPQSIGGWDNYSSSQFVGICRYLQNWTALDGSNYLGFGTTSKYYIEKGGSFTDITPLRKTSTLTNALTATNGSTSLKITDVGHGAGEGDYITISGATGLGGNVTATVLNKEYVIASVIDADNYTVVMSVTANASDTGKGGTFTIGYQISVGLNTSVGGTGWGAGVWGGASTPYFSGTIASGGIATTSGSSNIVITYAAHGLVANDSILISGLASSVGGILPEFINRGFTVVSVTTNTITVTTPSTAATSTTTSTGTASILGYKSTANGGTSVGWGNAAAVSLGNSLRLWSSDTWGQDLFINVRNGGIYYWSASTPSLRAVELSTLTTDPMVPTISSLIRVSDSDRSVIVFGANEVNGGTQDPLLIRWSDQEDYTVWTPTVTNSAGDLRLGTGSRIVHAVETKREILVFTDVATYSMQYIGPPYTFGITQLSANTTIMGFNCVANVDDSVYWMGEGKFYSYNGRTEELPCPLINYIFNNFNYAQSDKVFAAVNSKYNEVTWFYPTSSSSENDAWVTYNYADKAWTYGTTWSRSAWIDSGTSGYPIAASIDGYLYNHEYGIDDGSTNPPSALYSYILSSPVEVANGDQFAFINRIIPDITFYNSTNSPAATLELYMQDFPGSDYSQNKSTSVSQTATVPIEQFTDQSFVRLRGRQLSLKVSSNKVGTRWGMGTPRVEIRTDGRR